MKAKANTLKAVALLLTAMAILPLIDVIAKQLGREGIPVAQLVWARFAFGSAFTLPFAFASHGRNAFRPVNAVLNAGRALALVLGTACFFFALKFLPIADTLAIYFVQPMLITALSPLVLGETVTPRRWKIVALGFVGVLVIIRPGFQSFNVGEVLALLAGFFSAFYILITRKLTGRADPIVTTFQTSVIGAVGLTLAAPAYWLPAQPMQWVLFLALGAVAIAGHYLITKAYDFGEASLLSPLNYTEMVTSVLFGWLFFHDFPDQFTFLGVAILIVCAVMVSRSEKQAPQAKDVP